MSQGVGRMFCLPKTAWPPTYKFYLPAGKPIELAIEAFDIVGDFSKERAKYVIENTRESRS